MNPLTNATLWFVAVIALIPLVLWLVKRSPVGGATPAAGVPRQVASLPLSAQARLVTVEVGHGEDRVWLVLGVTAQHIQTVHSMAPQGESPTVPSTPSVAFAHLLKRMRHEGGDGR